MTFCLILFSYSSKNYEHNYFVIARALYVIAIVLWIGGVAFVTSGLIPAIRNTQSAENRLNLFEVLEGKLSFQAKLSTLLAGLTGFYMLDTVNDAVVGLSNDCYMGNPYPGIVCA